MRSVEEILQSTSDALFPADLGAHPISMDSRDCDGDSPLHVLLWRRDTDGAQTLIAAGAEVDAVGDMGETPLHVAISQNLLGVIEALLLAGANPDIPSEFGDTPRQRAAAIGDVSAELVKRAAPNN